MERVNRRKNRAERGLHIVEVAVVLGATLTVAALMLPVTSRARSYYNLLNAADEIISQLEYARSEAVKRDSTATVTFGTTGTYIVQYTNGTTVTTTFYLPSDVSLVVPTGSTAPSVQFFSSGKATVTPAGANLVLQNSSGTRTIAVSVAGNITRT